MTLVVIGIFLFCAIVSAVVAENKGRSRVGWFFLGLFIGPFAFAVALLPAIQKDQSTEVTDALRKCPLCAEMIKPDAIKCRFCGEKVSPIVRGYTDNKYPDFRQCPQCHYVFAGNFLPDEGWWCPNCKEIRH
jgi:hypothetical protein